MKIDEKDKHDMIKIFTYVVVFGALILFIFIIGCTKQPWLSPPQGEWKHVSNQYYNGLSDEWECTWLDFAKPTQSSVVKPLRFSRDGFVSYENCMEKKGYYK